MLDLSLFFHEDAGGLSLLSVHADDLFTVEDMKRMLRDFRLVLLDIAASPNSPIGGAPRPLGSETGR